MDPETSRELLELFSAEADEILGRMEQGIVQLEDQPDDRALLNDIFRGAHTLKGNSAALGFVAGAEFAHGLEDVLDDLRSGKRTARGPLITLLLKGVDALRALLGAAEPPGPALADAHRDLLERLADPAESPSREARQTRAGGRPRTKARVPDEARERPAPATTPQVATPRTLRVDMRTLDALLSLAGEIAIHRDRLTSTLERLGTASAEALELQRDGDRFYVELNDAVVRARLVPLGPTFRQHVRTVRDVAQSHGKRARLQIEGDDVAVDATVIDYLRDPLIHLVRNALDHGIESPEARQAAGKDPSGTITLRAERAAGRIVVEVSDDGAGLDRAAILRRARERGLVAEGQELLPREIDQLAAAPGLSTRTEVTDLSGRGVGLDVVRRSVEAVRGSMEIESRPGRGTAVRLHLPLTLAIIEGFHFSAGGLGYVVPVEAVVGCREGVTGSEMDVEVRTSDGRLLPCIQLARMFGGTGPQGTRQALVVVRQNGFEAGLLADHVEGASPTVVRPLGALLRGLPGLSGATIRRDGEVALILDVAGLFRQAPATSEVLP